MRADATRATMERRSCLTPALWITLGLISWHVSVCQTGDPTVDILKEKVLAMESSLSLDIKLLRVNMKKLSDELSLLPTLLKETLNGEALHGGDAHHTPENDKHNSDMKSDYEEFKVRMRRAFVEEKAHTRSLMRELKSEISAFGLEMTNVLTTLDATQARAITDLSYQMNDFKVGTLKELKDGLARGQAEFSEKFDDFEDHVLKELERNLTAVQTGLTDFIESRMEEFRSRVQMSINTMSDNVTLATNECVSGFELQSLINKQQKEIQPDVRDGVYKVKHDLEGLTTALDDSLTSIADLIERRFMSISRRCVRIGDDDDDVIRLGPSRLVNLTETYSTIGGRLEVLYQGEWGTVCDDKFEMVDAEVACRMLGLSKAHSYKCCSHFGKGVGETLMDDLTCTGDELSLFSCDRKGAGTEEQDNCSHDEDVGVVCYK